MKRSSIITWDQARVALLIAAALAVLGIAGYKLGQAANLFTKRYELIAFLPAAVGLREGGSVTLAGQLIGTVKKIEFLPVDYDTTRNLRVVMRIDRTLQEQIRKDSDVKLRTMGLLGDKVLDITPGTPKYPILKPGDTVKVEQSLDYEAVLAKAAGAVDDVVGLTHDLRKVTGGLVQGQGTLGQLLTNRAMYDQLTGAMARANGLFVSLQNPNGTFGRMMSDPTLYQHMTATVATLDSTLVALKSNKGSIGRLLADTTLYASLVSMARGADSVIHMLSNENGTLGRLATDQKLYDQLNKVSADLSEVLSDVRRDPGRYTKGLVCVLKCK